jgi:hypothetical protein
MKKTRCKDSNTPIVREFVLPDHKSVMKGYARNPSDTINNNIKNRQVYCNIHIYTANNHYVCYTQAA